VFAQPEVRHGSNTSFMWTLLGGYKNALRYGLTGDHIDAQEALRIGLGRSKSCQADQLIDECFQHRRAHRLVPPETVKINLQVATMGLDMMGAARCLDVGQPVIRAGPMSCCAKSFANRWTTRAPIKAFAIIYKCATDVPTGTVRPAVEEEGMRLEATGARTYRRN
jgi:hypothetical protein